MANPIAQYNTMAKKILARRGGHINDADKAYVDMAKILPSEEDESAYIDMEKKELKALCDKRDIEYKKKATNEDLIDLLDASDED